MLHPGLHTNVAALSGAAAELPDGPDVLFGADLKFWVKADTGITLNGSDVSAWADQSGNGNDLAQSTPGNQPAYNATAFNGKPGVVFTAADDNFMLAAASSVSGGAMSFYFVMQQSVNNTEGNNAVMSFVGQGQANDFNNASSFIFGSNGGGDGNLQFYQGGSRFNVSVADATPLRVGVIYTAAVSVDLYVDDSSSLGNGPAQGTLGDTTSDVSIGGRAYSGGGDNFDGVISEIVVVTHALDASERTSLDDYFVAKWGL